MLSPGEWWKIVPKSLAENLVFRAKILSLCLSRKSLRRAVMRMCSEDILFWINTFVWQYNPRKKGNEVEPFITWDFQDDSAHKILWHVEQDEDLLIEKSREMGASWLCLIVMAWISLFHNRKKFLCISHSEDAVDRPGDSDSLFWKVDFIHDHLPGFMGKPRKRKMGFAYPETHSSVNGAATTVRSGVGGRATAVFLDEFSKQRDDKAILGHTADTGCRIFNGTHYGVGTAFYELTQRPDLHKLIMHWSMHPEKRKGLYRYSPQLGRVEVLDPNHQFPSDYDFILDGTPSGGPFPGLRSPWYDKECRRRASSRDVAMHLDIDPKGSVEQFFDALQIRRLHAEYCVPAYWEGDVVHDPDTGRPRGLTRVEGGPLKLWLNPDPEGKVPYGLYTAGADISQGVGSTPSCLSIGNARTGEKVGEYTNSRIGPERFALVAVALCWLFRDAEGNGALFAWEMQGPGTTLGNKVMEVGYRNVYYRVDEFELHPEVSDKPGWYPSPNNKDLLLSKYRAALDQGLFVNRSRQALEECLDFKYNAQGHVEHGGQATGDLSGSRVNHGDHVIADGLCYKMMEGKQSKLLPATEPDDAPPGSLAWRRRYNESRRREEASWA